MCMNKKKLAVLSLVLVLVVVLCAACAKKEEKIETADITVTFENKTGEAIEMITMKDNIDTTKAEIKVANIGAGQSSSMTINAGLKDGAPDIAITIQTKSGSAFMEHIYQNANTTIAITVDAAGSFGTTVTVK